MNKVIDARSTLSVNDKDYEIFSLSAIKEGHVSRLPFSLKILLENLLRHGSGGDVRPDDISALAHWNPTGRKSMRSPLPRHGSSFRTLPACPRW